MATEEKPAIFISKLFSILRSKQHSKAIMWDSELKGIKIVNQKNLEAKVLPRFYRHNKATSFVRQLNMYGFHKIHLGDHKSIFCHPQFNPKKSDIKKRKVHFEKSVVDAAQKSQQNQQKVEEKLVQQQPQGQQNIPTFKQFGTSNISIFGSSIACDKQNKWNKRESFKYMKNSLRMISEKQSERITESIVTQDQAIQEIVQKFAPCNLQQEQLKQKIDLLKKDSKFKRFLRNKKFKQRLYQRLGLQYDKQGSTLSQLSIQDELLFHTNRSFGPQSLKLLQSGPLMHRKQSVGVLMSFQNSMRF